jgi:hypothetical protein
LQGRKGKGSSFGAEVDMQEIIDTKCFYQTVLNAALYLFKGGELSLQEKDGLLDYLLARQNRQKGFVFHLSAEELVDDIHLISGEKPRTKLLKANAVELETLRLLALLGGDRPDVQQLIQTANSRLEKQCFANVCLTGDCVGASVAYLRYISSRQAGPWELQVRHGMEILKENRSGDGRWSRFPYFFTLLWLVELPRTISKAEIRYTRDTAKEYLQNSYKHKGPFQEIRELILVKVLGTPFGN